MSSFGACSPMRVITPLPLSLTEQKLGFCCLLPIGKLQGQRFGKKKKKEKKKTEGKRSFIQKLHSFGRIAGFCLRGPPLRNTQRKIALHPLSQTNLRLCPEFLLPLRTPSFGKQVAAAQPSGGLACFFVTIQPLASFWSLRVCCRHHCHQRPHPKPRWGCRPPGHVASSAL